MSTTDARQGTHAMSLANLVLRFVLELGAIAAASYSGYQLTAFGGPSRWVAAVGAPLAVILLWALIVAPRTQNGLSPLHKELIGTAILLVTAGALALAGQANACHRIRRGSRPQCRPARRLRTR